MRDIKRTHSKSVFVQNSHHFISGEVLDVGCGSMPYKRLFWATDLKDWRPDADVSAWTGLDIRPVGDVQADVCRMPFEDASFDTVLCIDMLHQVPDPLRAFSEMNRVLRPGGNLLVCVLNSWPEDRETYFNVKKNGLDMLLASVGMSEVSRTITGLMKGEIESYMSMTKYRVQLPDEMEGLFGGLDEHYPLMTISVTEKEKDSGDEAS